MRLPEVDLDALTNDQQALYNALSTRPEVQRSGLVGPFAVWMHAPQMGAAMEQLGQAVRFDASLPANVTEVAICTVGAFYRSPFEFAAHKVMAVNAGVAASKLDRLAAGRDPGFEGDEATAHVAATELLADHRLSEQTSADIDERFGPTGAVELVTTIGYYVLVSLTLNGFDVPLADGMADPFDRSR